MSLNLKKVLLYSTMFIGGVSTLIGCSKGGGNFTAVTEPNSGLEVLGDTIKYDPNKLVNNGEPIELEFYVWDDSAIKEIVESYEALYPNVDIKIVVNPWDDYWTKLPLALSGNDGPALFNVHNSHHDNIINYMAPYDIPLEDLTADFLGVEPHVIDGEVYYTDYGMMTGVIFYNKDLWAAAGLTDNDIPTTWDEFTKVAEKLTIKDGDKITQAGFNMNGDFGNILSGIPYQLGQTLFDESGTKATVSTDKNVEVAQYFYDLYTEVGVGSGDFGTKAEESFGQGQSAMVYKWGHYNNTLLDKYPDINYGVFEVPTFTEQPFAYDRYNGESTFGINKNADEKEQAVAQDFIRYFLANDDLQKDLCLALSVFPNKYSLAEDADIQAHPIMSVLTDHIDHYIWPGTMPATIENTLKQVAENIIYNGMDIKAALEDGEKTMNADLSKVDFVSSEAAYEYAE